MAAPLPPPTSLSLAATFLFLLLFPILLPPSLSECPLDLSRSNLTLVAAACSNDDDRAKCCRYINACIAVSVARYSNVTSDLGVTTDLSEICLRSISDTLQTFGVSQKAAAFCGLGTKIPVYYDCVGRATVAQMLDSPGFEDVTTSCRMPLPEDSDCRKCVNAGILYLHHVVGIEDNVTLSTCRDATFATLASQLDHSSAIGLASCFFGVQGLISLPVLGSNTSQPSVKPNASSSPLIAASPTQLIFGVTLNHTHHQPYHLTLVPGIGIGITLVASLVLAFLVFLIHKKSKELEHADDMERTSSKVFPPPQSMKKFQEGQSFMFRKFSYKETKKATDSFTSIIGQGGFGTVYKAQFGDGLVVAVKRMNKVSEQGEADFRREIELLARLHHRHLVSLRGFCVEKHERFLMYEYMANGSLKDHLHEPQKTPLNWSTRIGIAIDVANALEYLHFYCDPPLCHRDIKSSNILLDENFVAKVADFGLAHASKDGSICFEPVNTDIRGTPGYMDPEYVVTQELTEKSDIYSYGVLLLEIVTGRRAIQDGKNLVEWYQTYLTSSSRLTELVDPTIGDNYDFDQLQTVVSLVQWCTQREGKARPSIKQVLRLLYESIDPPAEEGDEYEGSDGRGRASKRKMRLGDGIFHSGDARCLASSSSTTLSHCSRSFLLETSSPQSPHNNMQSL